MQGEFPFFSDLSENEVHLICDQGTTRQYRRNKPIFNEGDESDAIYFIHSGEVRVSVDGNNGKEKILRHQGPGEYFGELALIDEAPRSASVETVKESKITMVPRSKFIRCVEEQETLAIKLVRSLAERVRSLTEEVKILALLDSYPRLRILLYRLASPSDDGTLNIDDAPTHQEMANMIGMSREMVSRHMSDLKKGGYVEGNGGCYVILKELP